VSCRRESKSEERIRILVLDKLARNVLDAINQLGTLQVESGLNDEAIKIKVKEFDPQILIVRSTKIQKHHIEAAPNLSLIIRAGSGVDNIDVDEASVRGIFVANCPGLNSIAVAELTMGHLINMDRRIADNVYELRQGKWSKKEFGKANGLYGRTLGVIGMGTIGSLVVKRAQVFGMVVQVFDRSLTPQKAEELGVHYCNSVEAACTSADAITIHVPLTPSTKYLINKQALSKLKDGAYVINTSRGGVVNEKELIEVAKIKNLRYGCDVFENEPKASDNVFGDRDIATNPNIYGTHHIGASTEQAEEAVGREVVNIVSNFISTGKVLNCVNLEIEKQASAKYKLTVRHKDAVGVLAFILQELRTEGINVGEMANIIFTGAQAASARFALDTKPSEKCLQALRSHEHIYAVQLNAKV